MNDTMSPPLTWDYSRQYNRGKVLSGEQLEAITERFGRYKDVDGDGIPIAPFRTLIRQKVRTLPAAPLTTNMRVIPKMPPSMSKT